MAIFFDFVNKRWLGTRGYSFSGKLPLGVSAKTWNFRVETQRPAGVSQRVILLEVTLRWPREWRRRGSTVLRVAIDASALPVDVCG